jgi:hypothetical protein
MKLTSQLLALGFGLMLWSPVGKADSKELNWDEERTLIESETVQPLDDQEHDHRRWICFARNYFREEFMGRGEHRHIAEEKALDHCRRHTHHYHRRSCHIVGCNRTH